MGVLLFLKPRKWGQHKVDPLYATLKSKYCPGGPPNVLPRLPLFDGVGSPNFHSNPHFLKSWSLRTYSPSPENSTSSHKSHTSTFDSTSLYKGPLILSLFHIACSFKVLFGGRGMNWGRLDFRELVRQWLRQTFRNGAWFRLLVLQSIERWVKEKSVFWQYFFVI